MPIIPIEPANPTIAVLPFLEIRFLAERRKAVKKDIFAFSFLALLCVVCSAGVAERGANSSSLTGFVSSIILPSSSLTIRVEYCSASSGLWVTIITRRSPAISRISSIICTLVTVSSAPVGSSARRISGSFTSALAIATL